MTDYLHTRECQVLEGLAAGLTREQIAQSLGLALPTVKTYIQNLFQHLEVHSSAHAVAVAYQVGLLSLEAS